MAGFEFMYRLCGAGPTIKNVLGPLGTLKKGDTVNLAAGSVAVGATANTNILGVAISDFPGNAGGKSLRLPVIVDADAVFAVADANARKIGDTLDLAGASGAQTIAASSNKNFVVVEDKASNEPTKVRFNVGHHHYNVAQ